jgi:uncharacterized protein YjbJ (UPF0337 family)
MTTNKDQVKGRVKEAVGSLTGDEELKREGEADQAAGDVKEFVEDVADKAGDLVRDVKDAVHKQ